MKAPYQFRPARRSRRTSNARLMVIDPCHLRADHHRVKDLPDHLRAGDVLVFNDAATIPASIFLVGKDGPLEIRLLSNRSSRPDQPHRWLAVIYRGGDWRTKTEDRERWDSDAPCRLQLSDRVVLALRPVGALYELEFDGDATDIWAWIYQHGAPIQYSYHRQDLELWDVQTIFARQPAAIEAPSAALHFDWQLIDRLREKGVRIAQLTHAAGVSSTGVGEVDECLPFDERYVIPQATVEAITQAKQDGRRVIAVGTSATRALEDSVVQHGRLVAGAGIASVKLDRDFDLRVVDGLISGLHEHGSSHLKLLEAFIDKELLLRSYGEAVLLGYRNHEFGDIEFIAKSCA